MTPVTYTNPVLPGFYPDPSVCRVGSDYYLATSTFEYFPGLPIFHSRDLVHWRQVGHALARPGQIPLCNVESSRGIFAPTLRCHAGTFYLISTCVGCGGHFTVTASDPAGPWSEPVWLKDPAGGIDPSLLFDEDGRVYYTRHGGGERGGIFQAEIDLTRGELVGEPRQIWAGTGGMWPEGPHLYKVGHSYYLMIAEGGTSYGHMVTVARAASPWGPFEADPNNPILTHRHLESHAIQATGHADLFQAQNGTWWLVFLGVRPAAPKHHHLGRETFLAPVSWNEQGWPVVNDSRPIPRQMTVRGLPPLQPWPADSTRDEFEGDELALRYNLLRCPDGATFSLAARPGFLRLRGNQVSLDEIGSPAFVGRRQQHFRARASALLDFAPKQQGQEAGLVVRADERNHYDLVVVRLGGKRRVRLRTRIDSVSRTVGEADLADSPVVLTVEAHADRYEFCYAPARAQPRSLGSAPTQPLSSELAGGFTGVYLGMYACAGKTAEMPPADFDWFEYAPLED
jgi:xylan 1,4-beta-xylosidase